MQKASRIKKELARLVEDPPEGISCYAKADKMDVLSVSIMGPNNSPYNGGLFQLEVEIPDNYPFEPPRIKFLTPVYHPNIDNSGRICMDLLKMPPKGGWKPTINLENLLTAVQHLLGNPNPDDPLMTEIAEEYCINKAEFERKARQSTYKNAKKKRKNDFE
ncbi:ubiquitin-conjugating enzyme E2 T [Cephus cinctus]|uniref:Ubiquitin-conjugating enzyme E2 T n=1 Tax=Cephus cinctus TaxID=211228 RepID=A0AAJ7BXF4_CEPCN|nr:ubiquitin-conjugating enzyme E2 T [Cephus cinctus]XP_015596126.1 ubiquitin-conjugating enzyme E2 T [Cephus cinctus]XP_015596128.1 ubiquitin-conjugating enzyme E2 T [Cephus cinctus]XP_015596129.1 ubiquitin-conjugating enzyme E2 T [Cephus cinctus]XP_024941228.1 ubiquitin-conjugating enzyme E2 T [Cephus cinctus]XP_024941229.1 ubiquitin-conjugating enzyme E2 T [Cephus cinctus]XP_024941230.1 ubiquitin-conjugating enzyme E2 T [Cephus cinctus]XP_024941231.1 ubiquitin-conjugating enzyme E2 T [Cep